MYTTYISMLNSAVESRLDVRKVLRAEYHRLGIFLDCRCDRRRYTRILVDATKYSMYDEMHKWLIFGSNLSHIMEILNDDAFTISTDVILAVPSASNYLLYDVYNPCKDRGGSMNVTYFGTWNSESGLDVTLRQPKIQRRSNLHGIKLKVGFIVNLKPENMSLHDMMLQYNMKTKFGRSKFLYMLLLHLADLFNFTTEIVQINPQRRLDNSGPVFDAFKKNLIDFSASPVAMKADRLDNGDIVGPVWPIRSCFMFRTISSMKMKPGQFLKPLSVKVWYVILAMIGIVTTVLIIFLRIEGIRNPAEIYGLSVLLTIGALSQQGSAFVPSRCASRMAFLQILFFSLLILNYYSASVVSNRLKNKGEKMNDSLINLSKSNMKLAMESTPYIRSFLQVPDREVRYFYDHRWTKIPASQRYLPLNEGLNRVAEGRLAYHTMIDSAYPYIEQTFNYRSICELTEVHLFRTVLAFYARHRSPFTKLMKVGSKYRMYDYSYNWLVLDSNYNHSISLLNDSAYNIVTDVVVAISKKNGYDLYDVYNHCKYRGGSLNVTQLGIWRRDTGLNVTLTQPLINRRANMHGMRLKISGVVQYRPKDMRLEDYMQDINTRSLDSMHKFVHAMILHTGDLFNFSVHASEIIYWDRHSVHGLIFEFLRSNFIDFASNPRIMVSERLDYASLIGAAWPIR
ncbi:Glutamate receptor, ionotropic kainate 2 [Habropoda laboriosa]|uniref:Glutamate receptor, ionotropic kainate 2 n=1 Tax=Habropoda laboriosa TaxID=597456 RepID=A0A0L7RF99_9HYME|nr:Glutamate receptor, ionotropic kainate 2 [Habropoda laboriosa]